MRSSGKRAATMRWLYVAHFMSVLSTVLRLACQRDVLLGYRE